MYIFQNEGLGFLKNILSIVDNELAKIQQKISTGSYNDGDLDFGEYIAGYGFITIQRFINSNAILASHPPSMDTIISSRKLLEVQRKKGDMLNDKYSYIEIINACANWAKHEDEITYDMSSNRNSKNTTFEMLIETLRPNINEYLLINTLSLLTSKLGYTEARFRFLIPTIKRWSEDLYKNS